MRTKSQIPKDGIGCLPSPFSNHTLSISLFSLWTLGFGHSLDIGIWTLRFRHRPAVPMTRPRSARPESSVERFFLRQPLQLATVELDGPEAHHLLHVLRAKIGDRLGLFNGDGDEALVEIVRIRKRSAELHIVETWTTPAEPRQLILAVALPKGDRARWLIEKATELGVARIIPLRTARSVVEPREGKIDKLEQSVIEACKQ